ncbi:GAP family protein [Kitasatospora sp. NBC_00240]|uniref:GAP family protein n=1 Tax=Kitasatospora sp. NBC_00240 TaxID=2903567 RepID=UPI00224ECA9E|nr:GAP family protein [Kitasatospora sp. NBC_00240]MCX5214994.1 GAP family protein [Kitasatospora sp. NBC_00240]
MVLELMVIGLAITLEPLPLIAFVLLLSADRGVRKGLAFLLAWLTCLVVVIAAVLLLTGGQPPARNSASSTAALVVKLVVGIGLIAYGEHKRRRVKVRHERKTPKWQRHLDQANSWSAAGVAVLLQPWGLVAAGAAAVVQADLSDSATWFALFAFCLLAASSQLVMELYTTFAPSAAEVGLERLRRWIVDHQEPAIVVLSLLVGFWLVGESLSQLV